MSILWLHISHQQLLFSQNNTTKHSPFVSSATCGAPTESPVWVAPTESFSSAFAWSTARSAESLQPMFFSSPPLPDQTAQRPQPRPLCWQRLGRTLHHLRRKHSAIGRAPTSAAALAKSFTFSRPQDEFLAELVYSAAPSAASSRPRLPLIDPGAPAVSSLLAAQRALHRNLSQRRSQGL